MGAELTTVSIPEPRTDMGRWRSVELLQLVIVSGVNRTTRLDACNPKSPASWSSANVGSLSTEKAAAKLPLA